VAAIHHDSDIAEIVQRLGDRAQDFAGKHVLLTGAVGFLGRYFTAVFQELNRAALKNPVSVTALDSLITGTRPDGAPADKHIRFIEADVTKPVAVDGKVDYVIHAAGIASPFHYRRYPLETLGVAIDGTRHLLELARAKRARFAFFSSSEIYGDPDPAHVPTMESYRGYVSSMGPRACYDEGKRVGETLCHIYHDSFDVETTCIRPFNVFGPGMRETDYRVLPNFASAIKAGRPLRVYGTGKQTRTYCYVTDAMTGFLLAVLKGLPGQPYNIGCAAPEISVHQLVEAIERALGRKLERQVIEHPDSYPADEPQRRCPDLRKAAEHLDYRAERTLDEGLKRFFDWTQRNFTGTP
jgi:UDP-glucuronate decarboxylase